MHSDCVLGPRPMCNRKHENLSFSILLHIYFFFFFVCLHMHITVDEDRNNKHNVICREK